MESTQISKTNSQRNRSNYRNYPNHQIRKRAPTSLPKRENDIYVNNSTNLQVRKFLNFAKLYNFYFTNCISMFMY